MAGARSPDAGQLVAGDVVLRDQHGPPAELLGEGDARSGRRSGRTARRRPSPAASTCPRADVDDVDARRAVVDLVLAHARPRRRCTARRTPSVAATSVVAGRHVDAEPARPRRPATRRAGRSGRRRAATPPDASAAARRSRTRWPRGRGDARRLQPGRPAADDGDVAAATRRARTSRGPRSRGPTTARRCTSRSGCGRRAPGTSGCSGCTGGSAPASPARSLATRSGSAIWARVISTPSHDAGRRSRRAPTRPGRRRRPSPAGTTGTSARPRRSSRRSVDVEARSAGGSRAGSARPRRSRRARRRRSRRRAATSSAAIAGAMLRRDAGPRRQLVARQPQPDDAVGPTPPRTAVDDVAGEAQPVGAPLVAALVRQPGQELAHEAVLAGVDLDAVAAGLDRRPRAAAPKPATTAAMSSASIHFGTSRRRHLGHPRRRPQRALAVRRRALPAGVVERGDDERAVRPAGGDDRGPAVAAPRGQRRPLVRPVAIVDAGALDDDRAAAAARPGARSRRRGGR